MDGKIIDTPELLTKAPEEGWQFAFQLVMTMEMQQTHRLVNSDAYIFFPFPVVYVINFCLDKSLYKYL